MGKLNALEEICEEKKIKSIIQCDSFEHTINLISLCQEKNIKFQFTPSLRGIAHEQLRIRSIGKELVISFVERPENHKQQKLFSALDWSLRHIFDTD